MNYLVDLIIRPTRNLYNEKDLGDKAFTFSGQEFKRIDFNTQIKNERGHKLSCSFWCPLEMTSKELAYSPCIIYCHGNAGNKIDIIEIFEFLLWDFNICSLDFGGAGHSDGEHVTLGFNEKNDIKAVVDFLRNELNIQKIILWGRSMGAVSSLRYAETDPNLKAVVLDSPFSDFPKLCYDILSTKFYIPNVLTQMLINVAHDRILEKVENFDIFDFIPYKNAKQVQVPIVIIHGIQDSLVPIEHSRIIYKNLPNNIYKKLLEVEGEHNDCRSQNDVATIRNFIMQFSYDSLIIKEYQRRLNIKNAHLNYANKYGVNINNLVANFRNTIKSQINQNISNNNIFINTQSKTNSNVPDSSPKKEIRKMNNFNFYATNNKRNNEFINFENIRSKSLEDSDKHSKNISNFKKENFNAKSPQKTKKFVKENFNNNIMKEQRNSNIQMIKYHEFINNKNEFELNKIKKKNEKKEQIKVIENKNEENFFKTESFNNDIKQNLNESQLQIDSLSPPKNNKTLNSSPMNNRNRIRNERNNIVGEILSCEMNVKSDQFKLINLDKKSIRKKSTLDASIILSTTNNIEDEINTSINTSINVDK